MTHDFKFEAPDGKMRKADVLDAEGVQMLAKHYPSNRAHTFLDWFTYSDNSIKKTAKIDALTSKLQQEIESIKEYKQRLISDVVTGQIKVC